MRHLADQPPVLGVRGGGAGEIAGLLHQRPLRADELRQALGEPVADIDLVERDMAEGVALHLLAARDHLLDDASGVRALR